MQEMDYFRVDVCWVAMTLDCALIKLISQFLECCYGSFGCTLAQYPCIHTSSKWSISGMFACEITVYTARSFNVKFQVGSMKTWIQNN